MRYLRLFLLLVLLAGLLTPSATVSAQQPVVHAVLFYSPSCPHCEAVITELLMPLVEQYGEQLYIIAIDYTTEEGWAFYESAAQNIPIAEDVYGYVPTLIVGDNVLVGSGEIPERFPSLVEQYLAGGGVDWPNIPLLWQALEAQANATATTQGSATPDEQPETQTPDAQTTADVDTDGLSTDLATAREIAVGERFAQDPVGNGLSVAVLVVMLFTLLRVGLDFQRAQARVKPWHQWAVPALAVIGLGVAAYMSYVEVTQTEAVCGPIGDCNTVQHSSYALLFGFLPIGVFGIFGYLLVGLAWVASYFGTPDIRHYGSLALWGLALFGTLFSVYLTFLEPFVIGASCAWCLSSALAMTTLLYVTTPKAILAWMNLSKS